MGEGGLQGVASMEEVRGCPVLNTGSSAMASLLAKAEPISHTCGAGKIYLRKGRKQQTGRTKIEVRNNRGNAKVRGKREEVLHGAGADTTAIWRRPHQSRHPHCSLQRTPCQSSWILKELTPMESPCWSRFFLKDCSPWQDQCWSRRTA